MKKEKEILRSWDLNAGEWARIVEQDGIDSRKFTNPAIIKVVNKHNFTKILDVGCGEGWLTRILSHENNKVSGVDATKTLLEIARRKGPQNFYRITYDEIIQGKIIPDAPFEAIILNFCLYQKDEVPKLLLALQHSITSTGIIFIQTLHPSFLLLNELAYMDQWVENSWKGLNGNFVDPHSWYARTLESWISMFSKCNYELIEVKEVNNDNQIPVSIIFILKNSGV